MLHDYTTKDSSDLSKWEQAKLNRRERRANDPEVQKRRAAFHAQKPSKAEQTVTAISKALKGDDK
jgi:hypothetical protein